MYTVKAGLNKEKVRDLLKSVCERKRNRQTYFLLTSLSFNFFVLFFGVLISVHGRVCSCRFCLFELFLFGITATDRCLCS